MGLFFISLYLALFTPGQVSGFFIPEFYETNLASQRERQTFHHDFARSVNPGTSISVCAGKVANGYGGIMGDPDGNFKAEEFKCGCGQCGLDFNHINYLSFGRLISARHLAGIPFVILSSIRCASNNKNVGGAKDSAHLTGQAFDIKATSSRARFKILKAAIDAGFTRIGIYKTFIHIDDDSSKPPEVAWVN